MNKFIDVYITVACKHPIFFLTLIFGPILFSIMWLVKYPWPTIIGWAFIIYFFVKSKKRAKNKHQTELAQVNLDNGTQFVDEKSFGYPLSLYFDDAKRKFMFYDEQNRKCLRLEDFSFIREWELTWQEYSSNNEVRYKNVVMSLNTTDINVPVIKIELSSKSAGDRFHSILGILLKRVQSS